MTKRPPSTLPALSVAAAIAVTLDATPPVRADEVRSAPVRAATVSESSVDSKLALVGKMVAPGGAGDAIARGPDAEAKAQLELARGRLAKAREARSEGRLTDADALATEALSVFSGALRRVQSSKQNAQQARRRYEEVRDRVVGFHEAYQRVIAEKPRARGGVIDDGAVETALRQAQGAAHEERWADATTQLAAIAEKLELALTRLRDRETLVQELKFANVEEEYRYERNRNRSYEMLVEIAMDEQRIPARHRDSATGVLGTNRDARDQAESLAGGGDARAALKLLEDSTGRLIGVLRAAGYPIP